MIKTFRPCDHHLHWQSWPNVFCRVCKYRISSVSLVVQNFELHALQASSHVANTQHDNVRYSVPCAKGKPFHKSRLRALSALLWLPNRLPIIQLNLCYLSQAQKNRSIAHWLLWQSHWGNGIKDLLLKESTSPCEKRIKVKLHYIFFEAMGLSCSISKSKPEA